MYMTNGRLVLTDAVEINRMCTNDEELNYVFHKLLQQFLY